MAIGDTNEPVGAPSLSEGEIISLYQKYLGRSPDGGELASEKENALKYSAAGIERQIANRAGNVAGSGVRGDEGLPSLTVPYVPPAALASVLTMGPTAIPTSYMPIGPSGPTGLVNPNFTTTMYRPTASAAGPFGLDMTTMLLLAAVAFAAYYLLVRK